MLEPRSPAPPPAVSALDAGIALVAADLDRVERELARLMTSTLAILPAIGHHVVGAGGKRLRPLVTLLAAQAAGIADEARIVVAAVGELIHTATLLHDDVVDSGDFRRGRPSARLHFGNGLAVLAGDFCLARALEAAASTRDPDLVERLAATVTAMAEGEIAQLASAGTATLTRSAYYSIIDGKTATLFAWCAAVGGLRAPAAPAVDRALTIFGRELGFAFQIADDVLDYAGDAAIAGKSPGQDLRDGKITLPLLLACEGDSGLQSRVHGHLEGGPPLVDEVAQELIASVRASGALEAARTIAEGHARAAIDQLAALAPGPGRDALEALALAVVLRHR